MRKIVVVVFSIFLSTNFLNGQTSLTETDIVTLILPEVALLDIESGSAITEIELEFSLPVEAGEPITGESNNSLWINYTSAVPASSSGRTVFVSISAGALPPGVSLKLTVSPYSGIDGAGVFGSGNSNISLSSTPQACITGIMGAYTGDGPNNGHRLTYTVDVEDYGQLFHDNNAELTISFTLSD